MSIPTSPQVLKDVQIPLGVVIRPLANAVRVKPKKAKFQKQNQFSQQKKRILNLFLTYSL